MKKSIGLTVLLYCSCFAIDPYATFEIVNKTDQKIYFGVANTIVDSKTGETVVVFSEVKRMLYPRSSELAKFRKNIDIRGNTVLYIWQDSKRARKIEQYEKWTPGKKMPKSVFFRYEGFPVNQKGIKGKLSHFAPKISPAPDQLYIFRPGKKIFIYYDTTGIHPQKGSGIKNKKSRSGLRLENNVTEEDIEKILDFSRPTSIPQSDIEYNPNGKS